jgi:micrococcal nuclease
MDPKAGKPFQKEGLTPFWTRPIRARRRMIGLLGFFLWVAAPSLPDLGRAYPAVAPYPVGELTTPLFVKRVIDGDTVELANGVHLRYIGLDTPELRRKVAGRWVDAKEPYAREAYEFNRRMVEERWVRIERDIEERDRFGRWLAYVYIDAGSGEPMRFVNAEILSAGLARVRVHPPNRRYAALFRGWEREAREERRGIWKQPEEIPAGGRGEE